MKSNVYGKSFFGNQEASQINSAIASLPRAELKQITPTDGEYIKNFRAVKVRMQSGKTEFVNCPTNRYTVVQHEDAFRPIIEGLTQAGVKDFKIKEMRKMVNYENLNKMGSWERQKAMYLIRVAEDLGMDTEGYGELAVNENSGYTYLWLEDYYFTLYMPINCELQLSDVYALYSCPYNGEETETCLISDKKGIQTLTTLKDLEKWAEELSKESEDKENKTNDISTE